MRRDKSPITYRYVAGLRDSLHLTLDNNRQQVQVLGDVPTYNLTKLKCTQYNKVAILHKMSPPRSYTDIVRNYVKCAITIHYSYMYCGKAAHLLLVLLQHITAEIVVF